MKGGGGYERDDVVVQGLREKHNTTILLTIIRLLKIKKGMKCFVLPATELTTNIYFLILPVGFYQPIFC